MLIKYIAVIVLLAAVCGLSAQAKKGMTDQEFKYYESLIRSGQLDQYKKPTLNDKLWRDLMNDIIAQIIEAKVPVSIDGWKKKGSAKVPDQAQIRILAMRLRSLIQHPELEEVSKQRLQWFKNIGNGFIVLENTQTKMIRAVMGGRKKEYAALRLQYLQTVMKLTKLMNDRDKWKIPAKELNLIQKQNIAQRKKKADELNRKYEYERKRRNEARRNERRRNNQRKGAR